MNTNALQTPSVATPEACTVVRSNDSEPSWFRLMEDIVAYAAGYLEMIVAHHDSLVSRISRQVVSSDPAMSGAVGSLMRQLHIQCAIVESATEIVDELVGYEDARAPEGDAEVLDRLRMQLLDEIRGLSDLAVPQ